ncbi:MAG: sigma-70 family RNA polymerase sigma factor [Verrucomicrobiota bacterium]
MTAAVILSMPFPPAADAAPAAPAADGEDLDLNALVERARQGDDIAFAAVLEQFGKRTFHFVLRIVANAHDAEDVTQETFVKAWRSLPRYRPQHSFCPWLFTIARRTALNHLRARRPAEELKDHDMMVEENPGGMAADRDDAAAVWTTARRLKPDQYEALWLRYGEGFAVSEVARIMNSNALRVRVLLHRARGRMAGWLTQNSPET